MRARGCCTQLQGWQRITGFSKEARREGVRAARVFVLARVAPWVVPAPAVTLQGWAFGHTRSPGLRVGVAVVPWASQAAWQAEPTQTPSLMGGG